MLRSAWASFLVLAGFVAISLLAVSPVAGNLVPPSSAPHLYEADAATRLFDNFEGNNRADSKSPQVTYADGYLEGFSLYFPDTGSYAIYSDSWWANNGDGFQESGTIEFYYRPETFIFTNPRPYGTLVTQDERANTPLTGGLPTLAVNEATNLSWAVSQGSNYADADAEPPLYPGQWYHIAATWGGGRLNLYVNNALLASANADSFVRTDTFMLGGTGVKPLAQGLAARGRIDRFRLSSRARGTGEFPTALDVCIDSPVGGATIPRPFSVKYSAVASETRARIVDLYADTDGQDFNGVALITGLVDSGAALVGAALGDTDYFLYAVARAGGDSAFFYLPLAVHVVTSGVFLGVVDPVETSATLASPVVTAESYYVVLLNGGGVTSGTLTAAVDSTGKTANYAVTTSLMNPGDTASIFIWTKELTGGIWLNVRSDTARLNSSSLPRGIPASEAGLRAFGATVISTEFVRSNGTLIGDTVTTSNLGDTYAYAIEYRFSSTTTGWLATIGFDTAAGSRSFSFFYADTYGAGWTEDTTAVVSVHAGAGGGIIVRVSPITRDLPGGLGFAFPPRAEVTSSSGSSACAISRVTNSSWLLELLRVFRDWMLGAFAGRWITAVYYGLGHMVFPSP